MTTIGDTRNLPTTLDARQVAELFGCSYWALLDQVKAGTCPVAPLKLGPRYRWPTALVLRALGLDEQPERGNAPPERGVA